MNDRETKLDLIRTIVEKHMGWQNAISMKALCTAAELRPSELKADRHNPNAGYIPELRKRGYPVLSCARGYYWPRSDPEGREEDFAKHASRVGKQGMGNLYAVAEAKRAPKYAGELRLFDDLLVT